jgi:galactokinase
MDHIAATLAREESCAANRLPVVSTKQIPIANLNAAIVVCNTNVKHELASSAYNQRREECERGVELMRRSLPSIRALRDVSISDFETHESELPEPVRQRCRHVITENRRPPPTPERTLKAGRERSRVGTYGNARRYLMRHVARVARERISEVQLAANSM